MEKRDAETGNIIAAANVGFQVRDLSTNELIIQTVYYPTPVTINTFYTNDEGWLMLPCELDYGQYELIEVQTCYGYVLDSEPVPFTVDGSENVVTVGEIQLRPEGCHQDPEDRRSLRMRLSAGGSVSACVRSAGAG